VARIFAKILQKPVKNIKNKTVEELPIRQHTDNKYAMVFSVFVTFFKFGLSWRI